MFNSSLELAGGAIRGGLGGVVATSGMGPNSDVQFWGGQTFFGDGSTRVTNKQWLDAKTGALVTQTISEKISMTADLLNRVHTETNFSPSASFGYGPLDALFQKAPDSAVANALNPGLPSAVIPLMLSNSLPGPRAKPSDDMSNYMGAVSLTGTLVTDTTQTKDQKVMSATQRRRLILIRPNWEAY